MHSFDNFHQMDSTQNRQRVCIRIKFQNQFKYCDIGLADLTRDTFLVDGTKLQILFRYTCLFPIYIIHALCDVVTVASVVRESLTSANHELIIYDNYDAMIPFHVLKNVITTYMLQDGFHLKIVSVLRKRDLRRKIMYVFV